MKEDVSCAGCKTQYMRISRTGKKANSVVRFCLVEHGVSVRVGCAVVLLRCTHLV